MKGSAVTILLLAFVGVIIVGIMFAYFQQGGTIVLPQEKDFQEFTDDLTPDAPDLNGVIPKLLRYIPDINGKSFNLEIDSRNYDLYKQKDHTYDTYAPYITDQDKQIQGIVTLVATKAAPPNYTQEQLANTLLEFTLNLPYQVQVDDYVKYPVETIGDGTGDSEDLSVLYATLLKAAGYDAILLDYNNKHMVVGVALDQEPQTENAVFVEYNGKKYYYSETTGTANQEQLAKWKVGQQPIFNEINQNMFNEPLKVWEITE